MPAQDLLELARSGAPLDEQRAALPEALRPLARDAILLREEGDGRSRYGGESPALGDAPELSFITAVDLSELPRLDPLPAEGTLSFYYDFEFHERERMDWVVSTRVVYDAGPPQVSGGTPLRGLLMPIVGNQEIPDDYYEYYDDLHVHVYDHQLLGVSRDVQGPVLSEIPYWFDKGFPESRERYSEAEQRGEGWMLLAQFEESGDIVFGDAGAVYYVIPEADLRACRFDRAMGIMQCA